MLWLAPDVNNRGRKWHVARFWRTGDVEAAKLTALAAPPIFKRARGLQISTYLGDSRCGFFLRAGICGLVLVRANEQKTREGK